MDVVGSPLDSPVALMRLGGQHLDTNAVLMREGEIKILSLKLGRLETDQIGTIINSDR